MHHEQTHHPGTHTTGSLIRWAVLYDFVFARKPTREHTQAVGVADLSPGEAVLDVGCGPGTLAILMSKKVGVGGKVVGIDAAIEMVERARKKATKQGSGALFEQAAIESLPFDDNTFDAATSTYMLHHLPQDLQTKGVAEVRRVLKPGGRFVVLDFASESHSFFGHLLSVLGHRHGKSNFPAIEAKLKAAGFTSVERVAARRKEALLIKAVAAEQQDIKP